MANEKYCDSCVLEHRHEWYDVGTRIGKSNGRHITRYF